MPISAHPTDVYAWYLIKNSIIQNGPFSLQFFPPLWGHYMMIPVAYAYDWLVQVFPSWAGAYPLSSLPAALNPDPGLDIQFVPGLLFSFVSKIPFLISDILVALLLYKTVEHLTKNKGIAEKAALFWFLNPFVIWISAGWGMWDTMPALFSLAAFYLLLKKRIGLSAVCLSLGVASKLYPALFLVPIAIFIFKTSPPIEKWKNSAKFFLVFSVASALLFVPYLDRVISFFSYNFGPSSVVAVGTSGIPITLSYWSLFSLNLLFHNPTVFSLANQASIVSPVLVGFFLVLVYWRISKLKFHDAAFDLAGAMLLSLLALFLSFRMFCEQWFVWVLPFMIVLCIGRRIRSALYWSASFVALAFAFLNCLLPFFFLPLAPWYTNTLLDMVYAIWAIGTIRIFLLSILGCVFSVLLVFILVQLSKTKNSKFSLN
jgi:hypothetical protein